MKGCGFALEAPPPRFRPYPEYKDSGVEWLGEIPAHWNAMTLKRLVDRARPITYGIVQCGPDVRPDGIPYIRPVDMHDEIGVRVDALQHTTPEISAPYARSTVRAGDLVASIGPSFGKAMVVPAELSGANLTQGTARIAPKPGIDNRFLFWCLRSRHAASYWEAACDGATFRALTLWTLGKTPFTLPAIHEQEAIAAFLDRETAKIDARVAKKERLIELLQEKRTALITRAVTKGLDPNVPMKDSDVEWLGETPAHWTVMRLKSVAPLQGGYAFKSESYGTEGIPVVRMNNLRRGALELAEAARVPESECLEDFSLKEGDLLLGMSGSLGETGSLGNYAIVRTEDLPSQLNQRVGRFKISYSCFRDFLLFFMASAPFTEPLLSESTGTAQFNISPESVGEVKIGLPPMNEQERIADFLFAETAKIDALVARVRQGIDDLKEFRTALISAAVTGKIDVREEVAS